MKTVFSLMVIAAFLLVGTVWAGDKGEVKQDKIEIKNARQSLDQLDRLVDKWHEANLAGDEGKVRQCEQVIINLLVKDLNATFRALDRAERERAKSRTGQSEGNWVDDEKDLAAARVLLASKQMLLYKWKVSESFSLKYLVLSNYQRLLARQLEMAELEFAEDVREVKRDKK